ncbi:MULTISPECIES: multicopper oxidase domain-containing protein [Sulfurovum]|uniref:Multicopper oxidase domain-containing protein n=1 Tax=Sulfurovum xiamenensis TaxID=3019066 RepID=A0ABT7QQJ3_9BACT|nr:MULTISPECIES: multicopper oxidase domain-containing protein [Sulfurovum]EIF51792.1 multicopper oxidase type 3 [Sulfurovum sp. AR]MDM5263370.1 multicopper oxidase domain-containing protein [Sulfurovum xiamenensis]
MKWILLLIYLLSTLLSAKDVYYNLTIDYQQVNFTGENVEAMTINGGIPGPTIKAQEGDWVNIKVTNNMDVDTSIHWHGILFPGRNDQDGVPNLTTPPIKAHGSYTFRFPLIQSGTYWYHSHTRLQEQRGVYGSIMIQPKKKRYKVDKELVLILSDWTNEDPQEVMRTLKRGSEYYSIKKGTVQSLWGAIEHNAVGNMLTQWKNQMPAMDLSDVYYDAFLINGKQNSSYKAKSGEKIRLRIINGSASTFFYVQYADGPLHIVSADGVDVKPFDQDKLLISVAETYDAIITVPNDGTFELRATAQDGSGKASIYIGHGEKESVKGVPKPNYYAMRCGASMKPKGKGIGGSKTMKCSGGKSAVGMKCGASMNMKKMDMSLSQRPPTPYAKLEALEDTTLDKKRPWREVHLTLNGDMRSYIWSFNGKTLSEEDKIPIKKGENVRFIFENKTMMHHPLHLHGHFFRVVNENGSRSPLKHTVDIAPLGKSVIEFAADYEKDWLFHCHILYHMMSGMTRVVSYGTPKNQKEQASYNRFIKEFDKWYFWGNMLALDSMNEGLLAAASGKNSLIAYWESDYDTEYDNYIVYNRYIDRFSSWFGGVSIADRESDKTRAIIGYNYLLPGLIDAKLWVDSQGDARIWFIKELMLTNNTGLELEYQYDTELKSEWSATLDYRINKQFSIGARYHSDTKWGAGIRWFF